MTASLSELLAARFGCESEVPDAALRDPVLCQMAAHVSHRRFSAEAVEPSLLDTLLACAFSAPSKSDLQQSCVVVVEDGVRRRKIDSLLSGASWVADAPVFLVWCGDNRRIREICRLRGRAFANDHLDSFFNATVDCALVIANFIRAAEAVGLGCCPLSTIRNRAHELRDTLCLPAHVFPVAGMVLGWPSTEPALSARLPLESLVHRDRYDDDSLPALIAEYDRRRDERQPIARESQRLVDRYGVADEYGWSEDKARQVSVCERADFGAFVREQGFRLE